MKTHASTERTIFLEAIEKPSEAERNAFVDGACLGNPQLKAEVNVLLRAHQQSGDLLDAPEAIFPTIDSPPSEQPGTLIGPYKLLEQIGEGGMGVVYVAEQTEPVRRRVALKIIKPGMDTKQVIARFEAERQALAMMDHPNIARVLDAGTTEAGRPYFVMELVRGMPITEYCDKARLSPRQRLELFVDVCQAVQHAHQKGIIHRDLKPSNVMVTTNDGRSVVKVIDFGVVKAVGQQLTERTVYTALTQLVGTPLYMSPEQAELTSNDVDTRSDVYSLGVLLYELLTGQTPFDKERMKSAGFDEMRRIIREEEPPRPSHRISTLNAQASSTISQQRGLDERHLRRVLRGELDWIVMKALEKDRSRRYESASALAADIQRYLSDEPVLACPPTTMYRFQKFARKHKASLTTAAAIAVCLILGTTVSAWQAARATTAEAQAVANKQKANANEQKAVANEQKAVANAAAAQEKEQEAIKQRDEVKALADRLAAKEEHLQRTRYADHIHMAQAAWDKGDVPAMSQLLAQHVPKGGEFDRRGFEWQYLNRLSNIGPLLSINPPLSPNSQSQFCLSPDRTRLIRLKLAVFGTPNRNPRPGMPTTLQAWNLQTGQEEFAVELSGVPAFVVSDRQAMPRFTRDDSHLVFNTTRWDRATKAHVPGEVKIWDTRTGKEVFKLNGVVRNVWFSPDNKILAIGLWSQNIQIWDLQTGQERLTLQGAAPDTVAFSPDGKRLAAAYDKWDETKKAVVYEITIWDVETGEPLKSFKYQANSIDHLVFSPDGQHLLSTFQGGNTAIKLWDAQTGSELMTIRWDVKFVRNVGFNAEGTRLIALGSEENESKEWVHYAKLWNVQTGQEMLSARADSVRFSPDRKRVAITDEDKERTKVFDAQSGQIMLSVKDADRTVAFSPDSKRLATQSGGVRIWDLETGDEINHIKGFNDNNLLAFSQDGQRLIGLTWTGAQVWDVDVEQRSAKKILLPAVIPHFGISGPVVISGGLAVISSDFARIAGISGKTVKLFDAQTGQELRTLTGHDQNVQCVAFSQDGKRIASSDGQQNSNLAGGNEAGGAVKIWDTETGKELLTIAGLPHGILRLKFSPDGKKLAGTPGDRSLKVWDAWSGGELYSVGPRPVNNGPRGAQMFAFSPNGKRLGWFGRIWDAETGDELVTLKNPENIFTNIETMAFSSDGNRVVGTTGIRRPVVDRTSAPNTQFAHGVWDAETGELLFTTPAIDIRGSRGQPTFSPDGKRLADGSKIWDAQTGQFLLSLGSGGSGQVSFSPDGHRLAVVKDYSNEVIIYDATPLPEKP